MAENLSTGSLLSTTSRVEAPFVRVTIGNYTFGVYESAGTKKSSNGNYSFISETYPNYIERLTVTKINGVVNQYTLTIKYPLTQDNDPNFFEKLFSSQTTERKIIFDYGDATLPNYIYRNEEAIILNVKSNYNLNQCQITYTVEAVSASKLTLSGSFPFNPRKAKPSTIIKELLSSPKYKLLDVFTGMKGKDASFYDMMIASDDAEVNIPRTSGMSVLEYISYLVSYMRPVGTSKNTLKGGYYSLATYEDIGNEYGGPYFKVQRVANAGSYLNSLTTYEVNIGQTSGDIVTDFRINDDQNWAMFYNHVMDSNVSEYRTYINSDGKEEKYYAPYLSNSRFDFTERDATWWAKMVQYPVKATMTIRGLLRPSILMSYLKVNIEFYGAKSIASGVYIITSQKDTIDTSGFKTTLELLKIGGE